MKISRILHAGYLFSHTGVQIAFDPIFENPFSVNCYAYPSVEFDRAQIRNLKLDAVFISHYHDDHCSFESLNLLNRETPIYLYCFFDEMFSLLKELGFQKISALQINEAVQLGDIKVIPRLALDSDVDAVFQIQTPDVNILNVVDAWIDPEAMKILSLQKWDLVLWPFQTMQELQVLDPRRAKPASTELPPEWIEQIKLLNPRFIVPSSCQFRFEEWSWYNHKFFPITYRQFEKELNRVLPQTEVLKLNPGTSVRLDVKSLIFSESLPWVEISKLANAEYEYKKDSEIPSTAEIAKHFRALSETQMKRVSQFCESEILEKYSLLAVLENSYFEKSKIWNLRLFNINGEPINIYYKIENGKMELTDFKREIHWLTEISATKLYEALESGESLTSIYLRINDTDFSDHAESEIESVDLFEDPLLRCLYEGRFASFQKHQLRRVSPIHSIVQI
ncbi:MAG: MBL fold metallo-hydrolase [Pseudobdellovibrio sp.]